MIDEELFSQLWALSRENQYLVAGALAKQGYFVRIIPSLLRPTVEEWREYVDDGDLELTQRIELKHRRDIDFHSVEDYPFPTVIVDEVRKADLKHRVTLFGYMILNASLTGYLFIPRSTRAEWILEELTDSHDDTPRRKKYYLCPRELVKYHRLVKD